MMPYKLSGLTQTELLDLYVVLEQLGYWYLRLQALHVAEEFDPLELLEAVGDELFNRALEDCIVIPERRKDD